VWNASAVGTQHLDQLQNEQQERCKDCYNIYRVMELPRNGEAADGKKSDQARNGKRKRPDSREKPAGNGLAVL
jgi:hypothetical protein